VPVGSDVAALQIQAAGGYIRDRLTVLGPSDEAVFNVNGGGVYMNPASTLALEIDNQTGNHSQLIRLSSNLGYVGSIYDDGKLYFQDLTPSGTTFELWGATNANADKVMYVRSTNGTSVFEVRNDGEIKAKGAYLTKQTSAPPDSHLANGEMALWFDSTNGAPKLKVKAKSADGTVVAGEVALA
jgi:hypothetical protein